MVLMLPLGIIYFTAMVTFLSVGLAFTFAPILYVFADRRYVNVSMDDISIGFMYLPPVVSLPLMLLLGVLLTFATLHLARGVGYLHGQLAKHLLVKSAQY
jgi:hypothetical protein